MWIFWWSDDRLLLALGCTRCPVPFFTVRGEELNGEKHLINLDAQEITISNSELGSISRLTYICTLLAFAPGALRCPASQKQWLDFDQRSFSSPTVDLLFSRPALSSPPPFHLGLPPGSWALLFPPRTTFNNACHFGLWRGPRQHVS